MIDKELLDAQRKDAVDAWRIAINLTAPRIDLIGRPTEAIVNERAQAELAIMGAVNAQAKYTLSCGMYQEQEEKLDAIDEKDLRVDVYTHGFAGLGGSVVTIVHLPTGMGGSSSGLPSQLQNKAAALKMLTKKLREQRDAAR